MPQYNKAVLARMAKKWGFVRDTFEKVARLEEVLAFLNTEPLFRDHLCLKGGTAINLTIFELPRLSVDIDMDYVPNDSLEDVKQNRQEIADKLRSYMERNGYVLSPASRFHHTLDAFQYDYVNAGGNKDMIKIELNYSLRSHIFESVTAPILTDAFGKGLSVKTLEPMEIFAAKANALVNRTAARDLYDFNRMIELDLFADQRDMFRKCIVFYHSITADKIDPEFSVSSIASLDFSKIRRDLFPVIKDKAQFDLEGRKKQAQEYLINLMKLTDSEKSYLEFFTKGEYRPELLFNEEHILERLKDHPMAFWKCR
jgi:predicted nucleotidyltransferase component of viral defense system